MNHLRLRPVLIRAAELLAFGAAAVAMTWPLAIHLTDRVPNLGDPLLTSWVLPWVVHALGRRPLDLFQANIFHPEPDTLAYMDHMLAAVPVATPAWLATGDGIVVNNVTVIVLIALGGWAAYRLALDVTHSRAASAVAGVIFAFCPYTFAHLAHTNLLTTYAIPPALLFGRRVVRDGRIADGAGLAVFWVLAVLSSWYYAAFASFALAGVVGLEALVRYRTLQWRRVVPILAGAAVVVAAVVMVISQPYMAVQDRHPQATRTIAEAETYSATPSSLLAPPPANRLYGEFLAPFRPSVGFNERTLFPGVVPVALTIAAVAIAARRRRLHEVLPWLGLSLGMLVIAFGPFMTIRGRTIRLPFYFLYQAIEPLRFIRSPGRAGIVFMLGLAVLSAYALARIREPRWRLIACVVAVVLVSAEFAHAPVGLDVAPRPSEVDRYLDASGVEGAVVALPTIPVVDDELVADLQPREARYVAFSAEHFRPLLNGYSGFFPPSFEEMVRAMQGFPDDESLALLRDRDVAFVVVHLDQLPGGPWAHLADGLATDDLELILDDGKSRLYRLRN